MCRPSHRPDPRAGLPLSPGTGTGSWWQGDNRDPIQSSIRRAGIPQPVGTPILPASTLVPSCQRHPHASHEHPHPPWVQTPPKDHLHPLHCSWEHFPHPPARMTPVPTGDPQPQEHQPAAAPQPLFPSSWASRRLLEPADGAGQDRDGVSHGCHQRFLGRGPRRRQELCLQPPGPNAARLAKG